jgi:hypothetical protein
MIHISNETETYLLDSREMRDINKSDMQQGKRDRTMIQCSFVCLYIMDETYHGRF